jgi:integrase
MQHAGFSEAPLPLPDLCVAALKLRRQQQDADLTRAGVPRITVHGARKTCRSILAALDVHPRVATHILRHSKSAITMEIYSRYPRLPPAPRSVLRSESCNFAAAPRSETANPVFGTGR